MKIKQLDVKGFRSLKDVSWRPGDLNVVIGQNGIGKSNLLRMLELISVAAQGKLSKYIQNAGGMGAILWDGVASSIYINLAVAEPEYNYELGLVRLGATSSYFIQPELLAGRKPQENNGEPPVIKHIERTETFLDHEPQGFKSLGYNAREEASLSDPLSSLFAEPDVQSFRDQLGRITIYLLVEGETERVALPMFIERWLDPRQNPRVGVKPVKLRGSGKYLKEIAKTVKDQFNAPDHKEIIAVIGLLDLYGLPMKEMLDEILRLAKDG